MRKNLPVKQILRPYKGYKIVRWNYADGTHNYQALWKNGSIFSYKDTTKQLKKEIDDFLKFHRLKSLNDVYARPKKR